MATPKVPAWRLEQAGVIRKQVALLDPKKIGVGVTVFVSIRTNKHDTGWSEAFCRGVIELPEVMEFYRMTGEVDYLLRIVVPNIEAYDLVYKKLIKITELYDVSSSFAMEQIKYTTSLPLDL